MTESMFDPNTMAQLRGQVAQTEVNSGEMPMTGTPGVATYYKPNAALGSYSPLWNALRVLTLPGKEEESPALNAWATNTMVQAGQNGARVSNKAQTNQHTKWPQAASGTPMPLLMQLMAAQRGAPTNNSVPVAFDGNAAPQPSMDPSVNQSAPVGRSGPSAKEMYAHINGGGENYFGALAKPFVPAPQQMTPEMAQEMQARKMELLQNALRYARQQ